MNEAAEAVKVSGNSRSKSWGKRGLRMKTEEGGGTEGA